MKPSVTKRQKATTPGLERAQQVRSLLDAAFAFDFDSLKAERERLARGSPAQVMQKLIKLLNSKEEFGEHPACYLKFNKLIAGVQAAEERKLDSQVAEKLFSAARNFFEMPGFDIHHLDTFFSNKLAPARAYLQALAKYAPDEIEKCLPVVVRQYCTDSEFINDLCPAMELLIAAAPERQRARLTKMIAAHLVDERRFFKCFSLSRFTICELNTKARAKGAQQSLKRRAAFILRHGSPRDRKKLIENALKEIDEHQLVSHAKAKLSEIFGIG